MGDREKKIKSLRRDLEGWREVLVGLHSVLIWEKQFYPAVTSCVITFIFLLIWYINPAVLTLFSLLGLAITLSDFLVPQVMSWVYGPDHWNGTHERKYEKIIVSLAGVFERLSVCAATMASIKASKPKTYFMVVTVALLVCAWIGSSVDNLFLTYLIVLLAALVPGLRRQDLIKKNFAVVMQNLSKMLKGRTSAVKEGEDKKPAKKE